MPKKAEEKTDEEAGGEELKEETTIPVTPDINSIIVESYRINAESNKLLKELLKIAKE